MKFEKTNPKELENTITIMTLILMIAVPISTFLQMLGIINTDYILGSEESGFALTFGQSVEIGSIILVIGAIILLMFDVFMLIQKENRYFSWIDLAVLISILSLGLSFFFATNPEWAVSGAGLHSEGILVLFSYLIIFYSSTFISSDKNKTILYIGLTVLGITEVILGILQAIVQPSFLKSVLDTLYFDNKRAYGTMENPNPYGSLMAFFLGLESILFYNSKSKTKYTIHGLLIIIYTYGLFLSGTRGAMVGYGISAFSLSLYFIIRGIKQKEKLAPIFVKLGAVICCIILGFVLTNINAKSTIADIGDRISYDVEATEVTSYGENRVLIWKTSIEKWLDTNILVGVGISSLRMDIWMGDFNLINFDAHNRYIQILATQGLLGLFAYIMLNIIACICFYKKYKVADQNNKSVLLALLMAYIAYMVADIFCIGVYALAPFMYLCIGLMSDRKLCKIKIKK